MLLKTITALLITGLPMASVTNNGVESGPIVVERLMRAIERYEGALVRGTIPNRLKNPCALVWLQQSGSRRGAEGYAAFKTVEDGEGACRRDLMKKIRSGMDVDQVLWMWNRAGYAARLKRELGLKGTERFYRGRGD